MIPLGQEKRKAGPCIFSSEGPASFGQGPAWWFHKNGRHRDDIFSIASEQCLLLHWWKRGTYYWKRCFWKCKYHFLVLFNSFLLSIQKQNASVFFSFLKEREKILFLEKAKKIPLSFCSQVLSQGLFHPIKALFHIVQALFH